MERFFKGLSIIILILGAIGSVALASIPGTTAVFQWTIFLTYALITVLAFSLLYAIGLILDYLRQSACYLRSIDMKLEKASSDQSVALDSSRKKAEAALSTPPEPSIASQNKQLFVICAHCGEANRASTMYCCNCGKKLS